MEISPFKMVPTTQWESSDILEKWFRPFIYDIESTYFWSFFLLRHSLCEAEKRCSWNVFIEVIQLTLFVQRISDKDLCSNLVWISFKNRYIFRRFWIVSTQIQDNIFLSTKEFLSLYSPWYVTPTALFIIYYRKLSCLVK